TISGNTIHDLSSVAINTGTTTSAVVMGIVATSTTAGQTISQNTIYALSSLPSTLATAVQVNGIYYAGPTTGSNLVARNFIHSLTSTSTSSTPAATGTLNGIWNAGGISTFQNNMIRL